MLSITMVSRGEKIDYNFLMWLDAAGEVSMHDWSDETVDWKGISDAAEYIARNLKRWGRVPVRDYKEKWGTVRLYCSLGWQQLHDITHPGYCYCQYPKWLWKLDCLYISRLMRPLSYIIIPYHKWLYRKVYSNAVKRWPHLRKEITCCADFHELLEDL